MFKKINKKFLCAFIVLLIAVLAVGINGKRISNSLFSNVKETLEDNELVEKDITDGVNGMYITLLDKDTNVIASTNPDAVIHDNYYFSGTTAPRKKLKYNDNYMLLFEMNDTVAPNGSSLLDENTIYTMTLFEYLNPLDKFDDDKDITDTCLTFYSDNDVEACGGIYKDNKLKIKFNHVSDKYDVKVNYQFPISFTDAFKDVDGNIKDIDFGKYGSLQVYFEDILPPDPTIVPGTRYSLSTNFVDYTSDTQNYAKWLVDLKEIDANDKFNGSLTLDFSSGMGLPLDSRTPYEYLDILVDGVKLNKRYTEGFNGCFYKENENDCLLTLGSATISSLKKKSSDTFVAALYTKFSLTVNQTDVESIRVEVTTKDFRGVSDYTNSVDFSLNVEYKDNDHPLEEYKKTAYLGKTYRAPTLTLRTGEAVTNDKKYADYYEYQVDISASAKNALRFSIDTSDEDSGAGYFLSSKGFLASYDGIDPTLKIKIGDRDITFKKFDISMSTLVNGQLDRVDPALQVLMYNFLPTSTFNASINNGDLNVLRSEEKNADGDYYWLVINSASYDKANLYGTAENFYHNDWDYYNGFPNSDYFYVYFFNIANETVHIETKYYYETLHLDGNNDSSNYAAFVANASVTPDYSVNHDINNPMQIKTEYLNDGYVKWDVVVDRAVMGADKTDNAFQIITYLYNSIDITSDNKLYDVASGRVVNGSTGFATQTFDQLEVNKAYLCNQAADSSACTSYATLGSDTAAKFYRSTYNLSPTFYRYSSSGQSYYFSGDNIQTDANGLVHFVFFSKMNSYGSYNTATPADNYVEYVEESLLAQYDGSTIGSNTGDVYNRFDIMNRTQLWYPAVKASYVDEVITDDEDVIKKWNTEATYANNGANLSSACLEDLTQRQSCSAKAYMNGVYQFVPIFMYGANNNQIAIAENTKLKSLKVTVESYTESNSVIEADVLNYDYSTPYISCLDSGVCLRIIPFDASKPNIKEGIAVEISGIKNGKKINVDYQTFTDMDKVKDEAEYNVFTGLSEEVSNKVAPYDWNYSDQAVGKADSTEYKIVADMHIKHESQSTLDPNVSTHTVTVGIGHSSASYIKLTDFMDGARNVTVKHGETISEIEDLDDLGQYVTIKNMKIVLIDEDENETPIYDDGRFLTGYSNSTIEFPTTGKELYHLYIDHDNMDFDEHKFVITYDFELSQDVRNADYYAGERVRISVNSESRRPFECGSNCELIGVDGSKPFPNHIDETNHELVAYASGDSWGVINTYLRIPTIDKGFFDPENSIWQIEYKTGQLGKNKPLTMDITDELKVGGQGSYVNSSYWTSFKNILLSLVKYKDLVLVYKDVEYPIDLTSDEVRVGDVVGELTHESNNTFNIKIALGDYDETIYIRYKIDYDKEELFSKALAAGCITSAGYLTGTTTAVQYIISNTAKDENTDEESSESSSWIGVQENVPFIKKSVNSYTGSQVWKVEFNTGTGANEITINDVMNITSNYDNLDAILAATSLVDFVIKIGNTTIYQNNAAVSGWADNVIVTKDGFNHNIVFKDSADHQFTGNNTLITITYNTVFDSSKYNNTAHNFSYTIKNNAELTKGTFVDSAMMTTYPNIYNYASNSKSYLGNDGNDLSETMWKVISTASQFGESNFELSDAVSFGSEISEYMSINKFKVTYKGDVVYDSENNINNLGDIVLSMGDGDFELNKNGKYQFKLTKPSLEANSQIIVEYSLKLDNEAYIADDKPLDVDIAINNTAIVKTASYSNSLSRSGTVRVGSKLLKRYVTVGKDSDGYPLLKWYIDVKLPDYYSESELANSEVIITDKLSQVFELVPNSVTVKKSNGRTVGNALAANQYELTTEDNIIEVKLLEPNETPYVEVSFTTKVVASLDNVNNSVSLKVGSKIDVVEVNNKVVIYTPAVFGVVYSKDMLSYVIYGEKNLDGKPSQELFNFSIEEVDENKNVIADGYKANDVNAADGSIEFTGLTYARPGTYYYKIKEVANDENYEFDKKEYFVKLVVIPDGDTFKVESYEIEGADEIVFNNKTPEPEPEPEPEKPPVEPNEPTPEEPEPEEPKPSNPEDPSDPKNYTDTESQKEDKEPDNPITSVFVSLLVVMVLALSLYCSLHFYRKFRTLK